MTIYKYLVGLMFFLVVLLKAPSLKGEPLPDIQDNHKHTHFRMLCYKDRFNYLATELTEMICSETGRCSFCNCQIQTSAVNTLEFKTQIYRIIKGKMDIIESPSALITASCTSYSGDLFTLTVNGLGKITGNSFEWVIPFKKEDGVLVQSGVFSPSGKYAIMCLANQELKPNTDAQRVVYAYDIDNMTGEKYSFGTKTPISLIYTDEDTAVITTEDKYVYVERDKNQDISFRVEERKEDQGIIIGDHKRKLIYLQQSVNIDGKDQVELTSPIFKEGKILFSEDYIYALSEKDNLWLRGASGKIYKINKAGLPDHVITIGKDVVSWGLLDAGGIWINTNDEGIVTLLSDLQLVEENRERTN